MDKLTLAHEYAKILLEKMYDGKCKPMLNDELVAMTFDLADAMLAEAKKREDTSRPDVLDDLWHEKALEDAKNYGVGFVRISFKDGDFVREHLNPELVTLSYAENNKEWQPDWSQAPSWASAWAVDEDKRANWFNNTPELNLDVCEWAHGPEIDVLSTHHSKAPTFDYGGNWQDSLRKRP